MDSIWPQPSIVGPRLGQTESTDQRYFEPCLLWPLSRLVSRQVSASFPAILVGKIQQQLSDSFPAHSPAFWLDGEESTSLQDGCTSDKDVGSSGIIISSSAVKCSKVDCKKLPTTSESFFSYLLTFQPAYLWEWTSRGGGVNFCPDNRDHCEAWLRNYTNSPEPAEPFWRVVLIEFQSALLIIIRSFFYPILVDSLFFPLQLIEHSLEKVFWMKSR